MAAPTEGTRHTPFGSDGTTDNTIGWEEGGGGGGGGKGEQGQWRKKGFVPGRNGGGVGDRGGQHGDTVSVLSAWTWTWTWTWTLWNSRARRGTGREARHGRHSSGKMHKAVVSWLLYMTVLQQRPLPRNRGRLAGPRGRGLVATHEGPKRGRRRARGRGTLVFPGFAAAVVVVAVVVASGGAETRRGGQREGAVAVQLSTAIMQPADFKELAPAPLPEVLQSGKSGVQQGAAAMEMEGGRTVIVPRGPRRRRRGRGRGQELGTRSIGRRRALTRAEWCRPGWIGGWPRRGRKTDDDDGKGRLNNHSNPSFPSPRVSRLPCAVPTLSQADKHIGQSVVSGHSTGHCTAAPGSAPGPHHPPSLQPLRHYILRRQFVQCL